MNKIEIGGCTIETEDGMTVMSLRPSWDGAELMSRIADRLATHGVRVIVSTEPQGTLRNPLVTVRALEADAAIFVRSYLKAREDLIQNMIENRKYGRPKFGG